MHHFSLLRTCSPMQVWNDGGPTYSGDPNNCPCPPGAVPTFFRQDYSFDEDFSSGDRFKPASVVTAARNNLVGGDVGTEWEFPFVYMEPTVDAVVMVTYPNPVSSPLGYSQPWTPLNAKLPAHVADRSWEYGVSLPQRCREGQSLGIYGLKPCLVTSLGLWGVRLNILLLVHQNIDQPWKYSASLGPWKVQWVNLTFLRICVWQCVDRWFMCRARHVPEQRG